MYTAHMAYTMRKSLVPLWRGIKGEDGSCKSPLTKGAGGLYTHPRENGEWWTVNLEPWTGNSLKKHNPLIPLF